MGFTMQKISTPLLFLMSFLIASSGWILVPEQVKQLPEILAISVRFSIGALFLMAWDYFTNQDITPKLNYKLHLMLFTNGLLSFFLNYYLNYKAALYIPSGLIVVILSLIVIPTMILERFFYKKPITAPTLSGCVLGLLGISLLFFKDILALQFLSLEALYGIVLAFLSTLLSSLGYLLSKRLGGEMGLSSLKLCKYSMIYAGGFGSLLCLLNQDYITYSATLLQNTLPMLYLGVLVSAVIFVFIMELIKRVGPTNTSYLWTFTPIGAIFLSYLFEDFKITLSSFLGITCILVGGVLFKIPQTNPLKLNKGRFA
ncbi:hypothetical protein GQ61_05040 [Candidatus Nucleicultrix amoebiphila FS5]|uniref:EamA domain-containing protein n=2 Tax=Candidatus Nucleicultrix TaxID=1509243 RepID=A0A1W6N4H9_9PROT|nr:hypothetical protein GQ61_05040 [Candidatus Nucleicultrix amoebiphila FS5]